MTYLTNTNGSVWHDSHLFYSHTECIIASWLIVLLSVFGSFGNTFVLVVYWIKSQKETFVIFIMCLALIDLVACSVLLPLEFIFIWNSQDCNQEPQFTFIFTLYLEMASVLGLFNIALDRFCSIVYPLNKPINNSVAMAMCAMNLVISLICVPILCFNHESYSGMVIVTYNIVSWTALVAIIVLYIVIFFKIQKQVNKRKHSAQLPASKIPEGKSQMEQMRNHLVVAVIIITLLYIVSFIPNSAILMAYYIFPSLFNNVGIIFGFVIKYMQMFYLFNFVFTPFAYAAISREFRRSVINLTTRFSTWAPINGMSVQTTTVV